MMITLTDEQLETVKQLIAQGASLAELQTALNASLKDANLTYMQTRFLLDDLGLEIQDKGSSVIPPEQPELSPQETLPETGSVKVTMDPIQRPGFIAGGNVSFSDGQVAEWKLDVQGRLAFIPAIKGYRPSAEDLAEFQQALQGLLG